MLVYVTDAGLALLHELQSKIDQHHAALQSLLGERNARQLERLLTMLVDAAKRPPAEGDPAGRIKASDPA